MSETTSNVVTSADVAPKKNPTSFAELSLAQLQEAARAFGSDSEGTKKAIHANLVEDGITWPMYVKQFKLEGHESIPDAELVEPTQVELPDGDDEEGVEELSNDTVTTAPQVAELAPQGKYLIKFIGENPYFEFKKYKFTQEKPYGIMPPSDAQAALVNEPKKFRQAFPDELAEFYS